MAASVTEENHRLKLTSNGSANCRVYFYSKPIYCIDEDGKTINCPSTWEQGDRIAIGVGPNRQTFRYLRTTDTTSELNECGTTSSIACTDTDSRNNIGANKLRFMEEYNLKRTGDPAPNAAIASDALQDPLESNTSNRVMYGEYNSDSGITFSQSYVSTLTNYQGILNNYIGLSNTFLVDTLTYHEVVSMWSYNSETRILETIPAWANNSVYWLKSQKNNKQIFYVIGGGTLKYYSYQSTMHGVRPVIMISIDDFNRLK